MNFDLHNRKQEKGNACESAVHATRKMRIKNRMARTTRFFCLELERMCGSNFLRLQKLAQKTEDRKSGSAGMPRPISYAVFCLKKKRNCKSLGKLPEGLLHEIEIDHPFSLGTLNIDPFAISHDANEPSGYRIENEKKSVAVATDLGVYDDYTVEHLSDLNAVVLEANHDIHMLEVGPYPYPLKRRVMGDKGHLSNELSGKLLCDILHDDLQYVVLGHLSKENNYEELAYETVKLEISIGDNPYKGDDIPMMVAKRDQVSDIITL